MMVQVSLSAIVCGWKLSSNWMSDSLDSVSEAALAALLAGEFDSMDSLSGIAAAELSALPQAANERTSKADTAIKTSFLMVLFLLVFRISRCSHPLPSRYPPVSPDNRLDR